MPSTLARIGDVSRTDQLFTTLQDTGFAVDLRPCALRSQGTRADLPADRHALERPRRAGRLSADHRRGARARARRRRRRGRETTSSRSSATSRRLDLAAMMGLKRVLRETDLALHAHAPAPRAGRRARGRDADRRSRTARDRDRRPVAAARGDLPRLVRVARWCRFSPSTSAAPSTCGRTISTRTLVEQEHPDVVIQEIVGRHLYSFIPSPELVPKP